MKTRFLSLILALSIMTILLPHPVNADSYNSDKCGDNLTWQFDETSKILTISGSGDMWDYGYYERGYQKNAPWDGSLLESVSLPDGLTKIGDDAFYKATNLKSISIPYSVTSIGDFAFSGATNLEIASIPYGVKSIGSHAFSSTNLKTLSIPDSVEIIGNGAFSGIKIKSVSLPKTLVNISDYIFYGCEELTSIVIPRNVKMIGYRAFGNCKALKSVLIPEGVEIIGDEAFERCSRLDEVDIPGSVKSIGNGAFSGCYSLNSVVIPTSITSIGNNVFKNCFALKNVVIPTSVTSIGDYAFEGCESLNNVVIPPSVSSIGNNAFMYCRALKNITIPKMLPYVGYQVFDYTPWLDAQKAENIIIGDGILIKHNSKKKNVTIPNGVKCISGAFYGNEYLQSVIIPESVTCIGDGAFYRCSNLTNINLPLNLEKICDYAFWCCGKLSNLSFPDSLTFIGHFAFEYCEKLSSLTFPDSLASIGLGAYANCTSLTDVVMGKGLLTLQGGAFAFCENLEKISFQEGLKSIEPDAFAHCTNLKTIDFPKTVTYAEFWGFNYTAWFQNQKDGFIVIGDNVLLTYKGENPVNLVIPNGIKYIAEGAFQFDSTITSVTLPESLIKIYNSAFFGCSKLEELYIPKGVTEIGYESVGFERAHSGYYAPTHLIKDFVIKGYSGTAAEAYAKKHSIPFKSLGAVPPTLKYTIRFNANGGTVESASIKVTAGKEYGVLPIPTRAGYRFNGWFTSVSGGNKVTSQSIFNGTTDQTLYAQWTEVIKGSLEPFVDRQTWADGMFKDVNPNAWYNANVKKAYTLGLMYGTGSDTFHPLENITVAQAIAVAARMHSIYCTSEDNIKVYESGNWYDSYVDYAINNGIISSRNYNITTAATRGEFAQIVANAFPDAEALEAVRSISYSDIPDITGKPLGISKGIFTFRFILPVPFYYLWSFAILRRLATFTSGQVMYWIASQPLYI